MPLLLWLALAAPEAAPPLVADLLRPLPPGAVQFHGLLGEHLERSRRGRIDLVDLDELVRPFRDRRDTHEWRSEFWGKWFTAAAWAYRYQPDPALRDLLDRAAAALTDTQSADGYLGAYPDGGRRQRWDLWGRKYTLLGLLAWHEATGEARWLEAARRQAECLLAEVGPDRGRPFENDMWSGLASSSILEPMVLLYRRTGDARYRDWCRWLVDEWAAPDGPDLLRKSLASTPVFDMFPGPRADARGYGDGGQSKAYEMMSCFEGLLELYRSTNDERYREAAETAYGLIRGHEITVLGSGSDWERWNNGAARQTEPWRMGMETCVTVTWMKYAAQLLRLTGDPGYADDLEQSTYNALVGAHGDDGAWWCHHTPLAGVKERAPEQCGLHQNCCVANGPRGLFLLPQVAVMRSDDGLVVNLFEDLTARETLPDGTSLRLEIAGGYPRAGVVHVRVSLSAPAEFTLRLRLPRWSGETRLSLNGTGREVAEGQYAVIQRVWRRGDTIALALDTRPRIEEQNGHLAVFRGPLLLARDRRLGGDPDAPVSRAGLGSAQPIDALPGPPGIAMCFGLGDLRLCDVASAGNTWSDESRYRVWLPVE